MTIPEFDLGDKVRLRSSDATWVVVGVICEDVDSNTMVVTYRLSRSHCDTVVRVIASPYEIEGIDPGPVPETVAMENGQTATVQATIQADARPRCEVCDWPLAADAKSGCVPGNCCYRPHEDSDEGRRIAQRRKELAKRNGREQLHCTASEVHDAIDFATGEAEQPESILAGAAAMAKAAKTKLLEWTDDLSVSQSTCGHYMVCKEQRGYRAGWFDDPADTLPDLETDRLLPTIEEAKLWCQNREDKKWIEPRRCERCGIPITATSVDTHCPECVQSADADTAVIQEDKYPF
jgi:predicted Zn-ribbon and HTH transcriptional regulator